MFPILTFSQNWQWARHIGSRGDYNNEAKVITDGINAYVIGTFSGTMFTVNDTIFCNGSNDLFIAKYDQNGNELWVKSFGGTNPNGSPETINGIIDRDNQYIYLGGCFCGLMTLDSLHTLQSCFEGTDNFIIKMDTNGNFIWSKAIHSNSSIDISQVFMKPEGQIVLAGHIGDTAYFDSIKVSPGGFISIFDTNGKCLWAKKCSDKFNQSFLFLEFINNDILLSGCFYSHTLLIDTVQLTNEGKLTAYIVRFDSMGRVKWYKKIGGKGEDFICALKKDNNNDLYTTGCFSDTIIIDVDTLFNPVRDYFLLKLDQYGNSIWVKQGHSSANPFGSYGIDIQGDQIGKIYVIGSFSGSATFEGNPTMSHKESDFFLTRYNANGDCIGFNHCGKGYGEKIAIDNQGFIFCMVGIQDTMQIGNDIFISYGKNDDIVLAKSSPLSTGLQPIAPDHILYIYANPSSGRCIIKIPEEFQNGNKLFLSIYNNSGKLMYENSYCTRSDKLPINLEFNAKGIYPVTLSNGKTSYRGKIILQ